MADPLSNISLLDESLGKLSRGKPSQDDLESITLRPILFSFPPPRNGHSPPRIVFHVPQYDYSSSAHEENSPFPLSKTNIDRNFEVKAEREPSTSFRAILNCANYFIGVGVLGLPYAFRCTGWLGLPVLIILGILMSYTGQVLGRCQREHSLWTYPDIAETAYGEFGRRIVSIVFALMLTSVSGLFFELATASLQSLLPKRVNVPVLMVILLVLLLNAFTNTKRLSWLSVLGTISKMTLCVVLLLSYILEINRNWSRGIESRAEAVSGVSKASLNRTELWRGPAALASGFGVFAFSFRGHAVFPSVYWSLKRPSKFPLVVNVTFALTTLCYILLGSLGYLAYGMEMHNHVDGTPGENEQIIHMVVTVLIAVTCTAKFTLTAYPLSKRLIDSVLKSQHLNHILYGAAHQVDTVKATFQPPFSHEMTKLETEERPQLSLDCGGDCEEEKLERVEPIADYGSNNEDTFSFEVPKREKKKQKRKQKRREKGNDSVIAIERERETQGPGQGQGQEETQRAFEALEVTISRDLIGSQQSNRSKSPGKESRTLLLLSGAGSRAGDSEPDKKRDSCAVASLKFCLRATVPLSSLGLSLLLPDYIEWMCLIGAVFGLLISIIIPLLCYRKIFRHELTVLEDSLLMGLIALTALLGITAVYFVFAEERENSRFKYSR